MTDGWMIDLLTDLNWIICVSESFPTNPRLLQWTPFIGRESCNAGTYVTYDVKVQELCVLKTNFTCSLVPEMCILLVQKSDLSSLNIFWVNALQHGRPFNIQATLNCLFNFDQTINRYLYISTDVNLCLVFCTHSLFYQAFIYPVII